MLERLQAHQRELFDGDEGVVAHEERLQLRQRETQPGDARADVTVGEEVLQHRKLLQRERGHDGQRVVADVQLLQRSASCVEMGEKRYVRRLVTRSRGATRKGGRASADACSLE